jgi:hypothetical protein
MTASHGWDDCPQSGRSGVDDEIYLYGDHPDAVRARAVYLGALIASIGRFGGRTVDEMRGKLGWFILKYTDNELQVILDTARRYGFLHTPQIQNELFGVLVTGNVTATKEGKKLPVPRGGSPSDLSRNALSTGLLMWSSFTGTRPGVAALAGLAPPLAALGAWLQTHNWWLVALIGLAWLAAVLFLGVRGDRALKAAAEAWPRLEYYRPARYAFQTHRWRYWMLPLLWWVIVAFATFAILVGGKVGVYFGVGAGLVALAAVGVNQWKVAPLGRGWLREAGRVYGCRRKRRSVTG